MTVLFKTAAAATLAAASLATLTTIAQAADLGGRYEPPYEERSYAPAPEPFWNWSGLYVGANVGYGFGGVDFDALHRTSIPTSDLGRLADLDNDSVFGGVQAGYNWQRDRIVFGIETDFQLSDSRDRVFGSYSGDPAFIGGTRSSLDWFGTVRGRLGFVAGRALIYATGGLAYADVDVSQFAVDSATGNSVSFRHNDTELGYTVGGGLEYALTPNWSMKLEYQYVDLGQQTLQAQGLTAAGLASGETYETKYDLDFHTVRAGLNYRF